MLADIERPLYGVHHANLSIGTTIENYVGAYFRYTVRDRFSGVTLRGVNQADNSWVAKTSQIVEQRVSLDIDTKQDEGVQLVLDTLILW